MNRRALLGALAALPLLGGAARAAVPTRVAALDFGLAETLLALGVTPLAVPDAGGWSTWVVEPPLPPGVANLGADLQINLELLAALKPELIVATPYTAAIDRMLKRIAPVLELPVYAAGGDPFALSEDAARLIGAAVGREDEAERLVASAAERLAALRGRVASAAGRPLLMVNFMDGRHVRVYGARSLYGAVLNRLSLRNGWTAPTNDWGYSTVGVEHLAAAGAARLVAFEPIPPDALETVAGSPIWTRLPFASDMLVLPSTMMFGTIPSALRFARLLADRLAPTSS